MKKKFLLLFSLSGILFFLFCLKYTFLKNENFFQTQPPKKTESRLDKERERFDQIQFLEKAIEISKKIENERAQSYSFIEIGEAFYKQGNIEEATYYFGKVLPVVRNQKNLNSAFNAYILFRIGKFFLQIGDIVKAKSFFEEALKIDIQDLNDFPKISYPFQSVNQNHIKASIYLKIGEIWFLYGDKGKAISLFKDGISKYPDTYAPMWASLNLLTFLKKNASPEEVNSFIPEMIKLAEKAKYPKKRGLDLIVLGEGCLYFGYKEEATLLFEKALKIAEETDDYQFFLRLGKNFYQMEKKEEATFFLKKAVEITNKNVNPIYTLLNFGETYLQVGRLEEANSTLKQALSYIENTDKIHIKNEAFFILRQIWLDFNYTEEANMVFEKILDFVVNSKDGDYYCLFDTAKIAYGFHREKSETLFKRAIQRAENLIDNEEKYIYYFDIGKIMASYGNFEEATPQFEKAFQIAEEIEDKVNRDFALSKMIIEILKFVKK